MKLPEDKRVLHATSISARSKGDKEPFLVANWLYKDFSFNSMWNCCTVLYIYRSSQKLDVATSYRTLATTSGTSTSSSFASVHEMEKVILLSVGGSVTLPTVVTRSIRLNGILSWSFFRGRNSAYSKLFPNESIVICTTMSPRKKKKKKNLKLEFFLSCWKQWNFRLDNSKWNLFLDKSYSGNPIVKDTA